MYVPQYQQQMPNVPMPQPYYSQQQAYGQMQGQRPPMQQPYYQGQYNYAQQMPQMATQQQYQIPTQQMNQ